MDTRILPVAAIIPTCNRAPTLRRTLASLAAQCAQPAEVIVIDASDDPEGARTSASLRVENLASKIVWRRAVQQGAAPQRNEGVAACSQPNILFLDDDIVLEQICIGRLWDALQSNSALGGVNAMITNQRYLAPGRLSRFVFRIMAGHAAQSYAGKVLGPAVNLLPEDRPDLPEVVPVEWLNLTCVLYRRDTLPDPPFLPRFTGYSIMEDLTLSLMVGKHWKLANVRTARIYHDSQPGLHKSDPRALAEMQLSNRHFVMTKVLGRNRFRDYLKLATWVAFSHLAVLVHSSDRKALGARFLGELQAIRGILAAHNMDLE